MYLESTAFSVPYLCEPEKHGVDGWDIFSTEKLWEAQDCQDAGGECCRLGIFGVDIFGCGIKYREVVKESSLYKTFTTEKVCVMPTQGKSHDFFI